MQLGQIALLRLECRRARHRVYDHDAQSRSHSGVIRLWGHRCFTLPPEDHGIFSFRRKKNSGPVVVIKITSFRRGLNNFVQSVDTHEAAA